jgi:hypothetical protein
MTVVRPYYEFREVAKGLAEINAVGQRTLAAAPSMDSKTADELLRLDHLAVRLEDAIGELDSGHPDDPEIVWDLLPDVERELCRWAYEPPIHLASPSESDAERGYPEPTLAEPYRPRTLLAQLNAARVELAALEPKSLGLENVAVGAPRLSSLGAPGEV